MSNSVKNLNQFYGYLVEDGSVKFEIDYHPLLNSIDFLSDGEAERIPRAITAKIDDKNRLEIIFKEISSFKSVLFVEFISEILDFTQPEYKPPREIVFKDEYPSCFYKRNEELAKRIIEDFKDYRSRLLEIHRPSGALSKIVGNNDQYCYQILDSFSRYILKNKLICKSGDVRKDNVLKKIFIEGTDFMSKEKVFHILRKNIIKIG